MKIPHWPAAAMAALALAVPARAGDEGAATIHATGLAFAPNAPKLAIVTTPATAPLAWRLVDAAGQAVASGATVPFGIDAQSGDQVQRIDLSTVAQPGSYRLEVAGAGSRTVTVATAPYARLKYAAFNYFYQTRAGIPIDGRYAGGATWARAAGHPHEIATCFAGRDERDTVWPGCSYSLDVTGGWYDAGDQGKYVVNGGIALWTLQNLYEELALRGDSGAFADGKAALPEAGNGINDLLDEARWEMTFLLAMQIPDGRHASVPVGAQPAGKPLTLTDIDASGMVHHKVADRQWTPLPTAPADDPQPRLLYPPSTAATLNLAATAAQAARLWKTIDPAFAARCLTAAERAFAAALRHPDIFAADGFTGSGGYGDAHLDDEFFWAAAELYATTGRADYATVLHRLPAFAGPVREPSWANVAALGTITLATVPNNLPAAELAAQRQALLAAADGFVAEQARSGYRLPFASPAFVWGSNGGLLNRAMILGIADRLTGSPRYRAAMVDVVDYLTGRNPLDRSFVTGFGINPVQNPHHRFWAHALDARYPPPPPGVLSGGPNSTSMNDDVARTMRGKCIGMRCWRDANYAFTMNEMAINWNAPLVWVVAYLDTPAR